MIKRYSILGVAFLFVAPVAIAQDLSTLEQKLDSLLKINVELVAQFQEFSTEAIGQLNDTTSTVEQESTQGRVTELNVELMNIRNMLNEAALRDIEETSRIVEFHYRSVSFSVEMMMLGKSLRSYRRFFEGIKERLESNMSASDLQSVTDQLDGLLLGLDTFEAARKRLNQSEPYSGSVDESLVAQLKNLPPSMHDAGLLVVRLMRDAPKYLAHACEKLSSLNDMGLERLFLEHIRALQFIDADLAMETAPPMQEDFVMTEERLKIYRWLETQVNLVALAKTVELSELCPTE